MTDIGAQSGRSTLGAGGCEICALPPFGRSISRGSTPGLCPSAIREPAVLTVHPTDEEECAVLGLKGQVKALGMDAAER